MPNPNRKKQMNHIGYTDPQGQRHTETLGANGSGLALMKLFAVAYAASSMPDAKRAARACRAVRGAQEANPGREVPVFVERKEEALTLLELNGENSFWADFDVPSAAAGFFLKRAKCPMYESVLTPLILWDLCDGEASLPPGRVLAGVAEAWTSLLPLLRNSPAAGRLARMAQLAQEANRCNAPLSIR